MSSVRWVSILIAAAALTATSALAQRVNPKTYEPSRPSGGGAIAGGGSTGGSVTSLPPPSLTPSVPFTPAPQLVIRDLPVLAVPAPAGGAPPACYPKSQDDCAAEASQCLAREFINTNYEIHWDTAGPYVNRIYPAGDEAHARATDCATGLHRCLQPGC